MCFPNYKNRLLFLFTLSITIILFYISIQIERKFFLQITCRKWTHLDIMFNIRTTELYGFCLTCSPTNQICGIAVRLTGPIYAGHTISQDIKNKKPSHTRLQLSVTHSRPQDTLLQGKVVFGNTISAQLSIFTSSVEPFTNSLSQT